MTTRAQHERVLCDRMQLAAAALDSGLAWEEWDAAWEKFKQCRDEALDAVRRPIRARRRKRRRETDR